LAFGGIAADERLVAEYQVLGFSASGHPFSLLRGSLPRQITRSDRLETFEHGDTVAVAGLVVARQRPETARGFTFILLEDEAGMMNAIVRPQVYERHRTAVRGEPFLWIIGTLARDDGTVNIIAEEIRALDLGRVHSHRTASDPNVKARPRSPYAFLKSLRREAPNAKSWC